MVIKSTIQVGNPIVRVKAKKVTNLKSKETQKIIKDLVDSMRHHSLVGMAAPQIGKSQRIFVSEVRATKTRRNLKTKDELRIYINPKIIWRSKKQTEGWEGCGSVASADLFGLVKRSDNIIVEAFNEEGNKFILKAENLLARVIQHELDHLDGILFTDKSHPKTFMSQSEYRKRVKH